MSMQEIRLALAEQYIRSQSPLYRHYRMSEVQIAVKQFTGVTVSRDEAAQVVQKIRDDLGYGKIAEYNL